MSRNRNYNKKGAKRQNEGKVTGKPSDTTAENKDTTEVSDKEAKDSGPKINDPEWYARDPQLLLDSASLNFSDPLGQPITLGNPYEMIAGQAPGATEGAGVGMSRDLEKGSVAIPGVCSLFIKHSIGTNSNRKDPANVAANALYTFVRYVNSGRKNYDPQDLFIYCLTVGEFYAFAQWCKRLYSYAFLYSQKNQYIGKVLVEENAVDPDDLLANLANFRYWLNTFINKMASFVLPNDIPYFARRKFMYDGLYIENPLENLKDQLYQFVPEGFYKFALDAKGAGCLEWEPLTCYMTDDGYVKVRETVEGNARLLVSEIMTYGNDLIGRVMGDEDFGLMSGDLLKAFGNNIMAAETLPPEYYTIPHYDLTVLSQFKNATINGFAARNDWYASNFKMKTGDADFSYKFGNIYQDLNGNLVSKEGFNTEYLLDGKAIKLVSGFAQKLISSELAMPTPADNIECTRLTSISSRDYSKTDLYENDWNNLSTGVDFVVMSRVRTAKVNDDGDVVSDAYTSSASCLTGNNADYPLSVLLNFKYAPIMYDVTMIKNAPGVINPDFDTVTSIKCMSNIDNYTKMNGYTLNKMHECALLSLFFVPGVAKMINYVTSGRKAE